LHDVTDIKIIINISLREKFVSAGTEIELTPNHSRAADKAMRQDSLTDFIYKAGVEAALFFELVV
jgi:hypothetical protein